MPYDPTVIGMREAVTKAILAMLTAKLPDLNTSFNRDNQTSILLNADFGGELDASRCIVKGEPDTTWLQQNGAVRIYVSAGGPKTGLSREVNIAYQEMARKANTFSTFVSALLHPSTYKLVGDAETAQTQATMRAYATDRLEDWLSAVLNDHQYMQSYQQAQGFVGNAVLALESTVIRPEGDLLKDCSAKMVFKELFMKGVDFNTALYGVHAVHTGRLSG